ncbi:uncharacterized protein [Epargyreus clarus]|uniref:uncharacterized protein n=1 Tax=Epargyreus clarus TaxID=520877 RepID=UPI003C3000DE
MEKPSFKLVGAPCGQHGQYTFYKAIRFTGPQERIVAIGDFFFVKIWQDSELVSIGELQLLWTDRVSDQTLVSLRLYFLPENTPDGRSLHGEDEVLAINEKVVVRAEDLVSWTWSGVGWRWGLRAVWRGACAPPPVPPACAPLHRAKLDFSDVDQEKSNITVDTDSPGVVVFSYPRYCRYRALLSRLEGVQGDWLRDSLVAALGGYAAPTTNTRILYCKDTFEYPELEGHEFVCNHLAPKLKGRPRGRRRRAPSRDRDQSPSSRSSDSDGAPSGHVRIEPQTPRRLSLRNGAERRHSSSEEERRPQTAEDAAFLAQLRTFYARSDRAHALRGLPHLSLRELYTGVVSRGGYEAVCRRKLWRVLHADQPARTRRLYEKFLLPFENHERRIGRRANGVRAPSPAPSRPAEELNREFLASLPEPPPAEDLDQKFDKPSIEKTPDKSGAPEPTECSATDEDKRPSESFLQQLAQRLALGNQQPSLPPPSSALSSLSSLGDKYAVNGHATLTTEQKARPVGRSSLRAVRVKPTRPQPAANTPPAAASEPPAITNFGIHRPPPAALDDDIVEVPYKPKTPEIIDLDEYPESPDSQVKKKKLDILKERGLEVTAVPPAWPQPLTPITPLIAPNPIMLNPAVQHQIMTQAQIFQMYNIIPPNYPNGIQPPKVIQATSIFGSSGPEKTVYGNPKDPFMPPPHILHGSPVKPQRIQTPTAPPQDILDLTCKTSPGPKPAVEIVRVPSAPSPSKNTAQNLSKNYTLLDGKAVVGSNLEITLVNPKGQTPKRPSQKRSSNGKFMSAKTPPKEYPKPYQSPAKKNPIVVPNFQSNTRDDVSPTSSTGSRDSQNTQSAQNNILNAFKGQSNLAQLMEIQKNSVPNMTQFIDPMYMSAFYNSLGQMDQRQLAMYRDFMANQFRGYSGLLNIGTPTTKN